MVDPKIESLLTVVKYGNFTRAAEVLSLTQPAISHHIKQLENELGVVIFSRKKGDLKLTKAGEIVVKYALRINAVYDRMKEVLSDRENNIERLRIGITHTAESNVIAEVLAKYGNDNPDIIITIITDSIKNLYSMLENYEIDFAIVEGMSGNTETNSLLLDTDYLVCAVANENPISKQSMITIEELRKQRLILRLPMSGTVNLFVSSLESINRSIDEFNVILEVDNIDTIKTLIRKNLGVSILPKSTCMDEVRKKKMTILPIENLSMIRETNIVYLKDFRHTEVLQDITKLYNKILKMQVVK
ncbi:MAG: LysR family transcriptional regulator [Clostridia bacterium]|nr:LysR family transcriptional regulator [Clostridia bacterium]